MLGTCVARFCHSIGQPTTHKSLAMKVAGASKPGKSAVVGKSGKAVTAAGKSGKSACAGKSGKSLNGCVAASKTVKPGTVVASKPGKPAVAGKSGKAVTAMQLAKSLNGCAAASKVKIVNKFDGSKKKLKKKHKWPKVDPEVVTAMLARSRMTMNQGTSVGLRSLGRLSFPTSAS